MTLQNGLCWNWFETQIVISPEGSEIYLFFQILRNKFDEFKRQVEASQERFNRCERMAKWLVEDKGPYTKDVLKRQDHLG